MKGGISCVYCYVFAGSSHDGYCRPSGKILGGDDAGIHRHDSAHSGRAVVYALKTDKIQAPIGKISLLVIAAGAIGNVIDRVVNHYVVDMIQLEFIRFPIFNIADIYVCVGVALFAFYYLFIHKDAEEADK